MTTNRLSPALIVPVLALFLLNLVNGIHSYTERESLLEMPSVASVLANITTTTVISSREESSKFWLGRIVGFSVAVAIILIQVVVFWCARQCQMSANDEVTTVCINDFLHEYCLLDLFDYLPLAELVRIDQVCAPWNALRWSSLCRRKKLTLLMKDHSFDINHGRDCFAIPYSDEIRKVIPGWKLLSERIAREDDNPKTSDPNTSIRWSQLKISEITFETTNWLFENFRNINSLTISVGELRPFNTEALKWLLDKWSSNLVSLKLYLGNPSLTNMFRIYGSINSMKVLRHFTLVVAGRLQLKPSASMPILSRLEEFYIFSADPTSLILDLLKNNAPNNRRLKRIGMANRLTLNSDTLGSLLSLEDNLIATQFVYLNWHFTIPPHQLHLFCNKFSSLESIELTIQSGQSYARLINCLAQLKQLIYLQLSLNPNCKISQFMQNDDHQYGQLAQLHSVKTFKLCASIESHREIIQMKLHLTIPNVQVIAIGKHQKGCSICQHKDENDISLDDFQNDEQLMLNCAVELCTSTFTTFVLYPGLHTIYVGRSKIEPICKYRRFYY